MYIRLICKRYLLYSRGGDARQTVDVVRPLHFQLLQVLTQASQAEPASVRVAAMDWSVIDAPAGETHIPSVAPSGVHDPAPLFPL